RPTRMVLRATRRPRLADRRVTGPPTGVQRAAEHEPRERTDIGQEDHDQEPHRLRQVARQRLVGRDDVEDAVQPQAEQDEAEAFGQELHEHAFVSGWCDEVRILRAVAWQLTTVADDEIVAYDGMEVRRWAGLEPDTEYEFDGVVAKTLP